MACSPVLKSWGAAAPSATPVPTPIRPTTTTKIMYSKRLCYTVNKSLCNNKCQSSSLSACPTCQYHEVAFLPCLAFHIGMRQNVVMTATATAAVAMVTVAAAERSRLQSALIHDGVMSRLHRLPTQQYSHLS